MAYHKDFWVVIGTAAPVIALAAVVSYGQLSRLGPTEAKRLRSATKRQRWAALYSYDFALIAVAIALIGQVLAFVQALSSLSSGRDADIGVARFETVGGLGLMVLATTALSSFRVILSRLSGQEGEPDSEPDV